MSAQDSPYVRVYYDVADRHPRVYADHDAFATMVKLQVISDAMYPAAAHIPRWVADGPLALLVKDGVIVVTGDQYRFPALDAERMATTEAARKAAHMRWHSGRNADAMQAHSGGNADPFVEIMHSLPPSLPSTPSLVVQKASLETKPARANGSPSPSHVVTRSHANGPSLPPLSEPRMTKDQLAAWGSFTNEAWLPFKTSWWAKGLLWPPGGSPSDNDTSQRGLLWQIANLHPVALGQWVRAAPGREPRKIIDYVLAQFHEIRGGDGLDHEVDKWEATKAAEARQARGAMTRIGDVVAGIARG